jgi:hypothetical protein
VTTSTSCRLCDGAKLASDVLLCAKCRALVTNQRNPIAAELFVYDLCKSRCSFDEAADFVMTYRRSVLVPPTPYRVPTEAELLAKIRERPTPPVAIEVLWDGDTTGWHVALLAVRVDAAADGGHREQWLATLAHPAGDHRVFTGKVPPYPEAEDARKLGTALAGVFGIPLYFPSPDEPDDECPRWWEQDR